MLKNNTIAFLIFIFGFLLEICFFFPLRIQYQTKGSLHINAKIESGSNIELYVNSDFSKSYTQNIIPNQIHDYVFEDIPAVVDFLRIDFTERQDAAIEILSISLITDYSTEIIPISTIAQWSFNQTNIITTDASKVILKSSGNDSFIYKGGLGLGADINKNRSGILNTCLYYSWLIFSALVLIILSLNFRGFVYIVSPLIFCALYYLVLPIIFSFLDDFKFTLQTPRHSIGHALYAGHSKFSEQVKVFAAIAFSAGCGLIFALINIFSPKLSSEQNQSVQPKILHNLSVLIVILILVVINFPDIKSYTDTLTDSKLNFAGFDFSNILTWDYLAYQGLLPYKDYWFPYGGDYLELGLASQGILWKAAEQFLIFIVLFYSIYKILNNRMLPTLLILCLFGFLIEHNIFIGTKRYLLCFSSFSFFYAITLKASHKASLFLLFGAYLGWCFTQEVSQIFFASAPLLLTGFFVLVNAFYNNKLNLLIKNLLYSFLGFSSVIFYYFFSLYKNQQLDAYLDFYSNLSSIKVSSAYPADINNWLNFNLNWNNLLFLGLNLTAFMSPILIFNSKDKSSKDLGRIIFAIFLAILMIFQKLLVRPHMAQQVTCFLFLGFAFYIFYFSIYLKKRDLYLLILLLGVSTAHIQSTLNFKTYLQGKLKSVEKFSENLHLALTNPGTSQEKLDKYYSFSNMQGLDENNRKAIEYLTCKNFEKLKSNLFVLGDQSYYYVALSQKPCLYISLYDSSSIKSQQKELACLKEKLPEYVIWDSSELLFDNVPNAVRVPLLFDYVINNYVAETSFGKVHILRRIRVNETPDFSFWSTYMTNISDLGSLPWVSSFKEYKNCTNTADCISFVLPDKKIDKLKVIIGSREFFINFKKPETAYLDPDVTPAINLNRLWFYNLAKNLRENIRVESYPDGEVMKIHNKENNQDILY